MKSTSEKIEKTVSGRSVVGYKIRGIVYINTTPHDVHFLDPEGEEDPVVLPPSGVLINARPEEEVVEVRDGVTFVRTVFRADGETARLLEQVETAFSEDGRRPLIIGSIIAAQAYPGRVVALCPAPGFERVPPSEKRMLLDKFTVF